MCPTIPMQGERYDLSGVNTPSALAATPFAHSKIPTPHITGAQSHGSEDHTSTSLQGPVIPLSVRQRHAAGSEGALGREPAGAAFVSTKGEGDKVPNLWAFSSPEEATAAIGGVPPSHTMTALQRALLAGERAAPGPGSGGINADVGRVGIEMGPTLGLEKPTSSNIRDKNSLHSVPPMARVSFADSAVPIPESPGNPGASGSPTLPREGARMTRASNLSQPEGIGSPTQTSPIRRRISAVESIGEDSSQGSLYKMGAAPMTPTWTSKAQPGAKSWWGFIHVTMRKCHNSGGTELGRFVRGLCESCFPACTTGAR